MSHGLPKPLLDRERVFRMDMTPIRKRRTPSPEQTPAPNATTRYVLYELAVVVEYVKSR